MPVFPHVLDAHQCASRLRQYKTRIVKWGETKTSNAAKRLPAEKSTEPSQAGIERRPANLPDRRGNAVIRWELPRASLKAPGHLGAIHSATHGISRFYLGVLGDRHIDRSEVRHQNAGWSIRQFYIAASMLPVLTAASKWKTAQKVYAQLLDHTGPLLDERNPIVVGCMLQVCASFYESGQHAVLDRFLGFITALVTTRGLHTHPLQLMASGWQKSSHHAMSLVILCAEQSYKILKKQLGPEHPQTLAATRALHGAYYSIRDYTSALKIMTETAEIESKLQLRDTMVLDAQSRVNRTLIALNRLDEAVAGLEESEATACRLAADGLILPDQLRVAIEKIEVSRAEILRHKLDPRAEEILSRIVASYRPVDNENGMRFGVFCNREAHLACIRRTLRSGIVEPHCLI
ncbi:hypothetical protein GQ53DRAFT_136189 [Thozetella sp. PMI_491]|nr:hypothetical protein GQ53DRAFT_136189 [Thozetella sp. PMI_491]